MLTEVKSFVRGLQTIAVVLLWFLGTTVACANPIVVTPYESLPWLKLGSTRQSDVIRAIGQPTAIIDEVRFRSEMIDRRSDYKALGLMVWYLLDGEPDPKVNQVVFEPPFKGQSSLGLALGSKREKVISKLMGLYKADEDEELDEPDFVMLDPLVSDNPKIDLWFTNGSLSQVRLTSFLPPSENANRDRARVVALVKQDNLQDGFIEVPRCEFINIFNRKLKRLGQKRIVVADSNVNWRLELFENNQNGTWTLLGYSKDKLSSSTSHKTCELAGGDAQGSTASSYRAARWYQKYF